jgi:hypothetical protein
MNRPLTLRQLSKPQSEKQGAERSNVGVFLGVLDE